MPTRWVVVAKLQARRSKVRPGSRDEQIIERAIDLALSDRRTQQDPDYLYKNVLRNATYAHDRSGRRACASLLRYCGDVDICLADNSIDVVATGTVEEDAEATELHQHLTNVAAGLGNHGVTFLEHLMTGRRPTEAGLAVGISKATAYRTWATLKKHAVAWTQQAG
ncbi:hypothetical protein [Nonomuraea sp. NPDC046570]|uniref:hypothetical protein n=1 Tax=Nonomuraea sp. NPDC046570 TaxID=3155255 RepID=UPI0033D3E923